MASQASWTRQSRPPTAAGPTRWRRPAVAAVAALTILAAGCGDGDGSDGEAATDTVAEPEATAELLDADAFAGYVEEHPDAPVVNVHIPYEGHIEGTDAFVPFEEIGDWDGLPEDRTAPIALYCRSGNMSATAADTLAAAGYTNIVDLDGGMNAWTASGRQLLDEEP
ncbi:MAG: rhodanese-like domain-containing protein [Actinomycetota bacterium]|nr:rhodanese-like domain-containing protein [Actinomycetota bacterium]